MRDLSACEPNASILTSQVIVIHVQDDDPQKNLYLVSSPRSIENLKKPSLSEEKDNLSAEHQIAEPKEHKFNQNTIANPLVSLPFSRLSILSMVFIILAQVYLLASNSM